MTADAPDPAAVSATRAEHLRRVQRVVAHIHARLADPLDIAALSRLAHLSPAHLNVVFRGVVGESVYQHVRRLRLERAAAFLRLSDEPVLEIGLACGFDSHEGFTRAFTAAFGCSPRAFRADRRRAATLPAPTDLHFRPDGGPADFTPAPDLGAALKVEMVELPEQRLACLRHVGPYEKAQRVWPRFLWWAVKTGRLKPGAVFYGLNYDDPEVTPDELQRYDAAMVVEPGFRGDGEVFGFTVAAGLFAKTTSTGGMADYFRTSEAFVNQWLPNSGYALRALYGLDRYHAPGNVFNPVRVLQFCLSNLHVDLHIPIGPGPFGRSLTV